MCIFYHIIVPFSINIGYIIYSARRKAPLVRDMQEGNALSDIMEADPGA